MDFKINTPQEARQVATTVTQAVTLELIDATGGATPLETELAYDPADPFAVSATFNTVAGQVRWTFGRDLLIGGLYEPTGDGDVHVWPCLDDEANPVVIIELCSPDGTALLQAPSRTVHDFVVRTLEVVPAGEESTHLALDALITKLLSD